MDTHYCKKRILRKLRKNSGKSLKSIVFWTSRENLYEWVSSRKLYRKHWSKCSDASIDRNVRIKTYGNRKLQIFCRWILKEFNIINSYVWVFSRDSLIYTKNLLILTLCTSLFSDVIPSYLLLSLLSCRRVHYVNKDRSFFSQVILRQMLFDEFWQNLAVSSSDESLLKHDPKRWNSFWLA